MTDPSDKACCSTKAVGAPAFDKGRVQFNDWVDESFKIHRSEFEKEVKEGKINEDQFKTLELKNFEVFKPLVERHPNRGIVCIYDIFGYFPQTMTGAQRLADSTGIAVYMPDFLGSFQYDLQKHLDGGPDIGTWFGQIGRPQYRMEQFKHFGKYLKEKKDKHWVGGYGLCWGGGMNILVGSQDNISFDAVAAVHPAFIDPSMKQPGFGKGLKVPLGVFPSEPEMQREEGKDKSPAEQLAEDLKHSKVAAKSVFHPYPKQVHGFAGARAVSKLGKDPKKEDEEAYAAFVDFYARLTEFYLNAAN